MGGDFNAHIGGGEPRGGVCGGFGLRQSNEQGEELKNWCEVNGLCWVNGFYSDSVEIDGFHFPFVFDLV